VAEIVAEISSSEYAIDHRLSRFRWMPMGDIILDRIFFGSVKELEEIYFD
jgi:hypothetical protein